MTPQTPPATDPNSIQLPPGATLVPPPDSSQLPPGATMVDDGSGVNIGAAPSGALDNPYNVQIGTLPGGAPLYRYVPPPPAPPPDKLPPSQPQQPQVWGELPSPIKQAGSQLYQASSNAAKYIANLFHVLDAGASMLAPGSTEGKLGIYKQVENWARQQQQGAQQTASDLAAGQPEDPVSQSYRTVLGAAFNLPAYAVANELGGPVLGMAGMGALENADQGPGNTAMGALQGGLTGGVLHVLGPGNRVVRLIGNAAMTYANAIMQGADHQTALANALTMGGLGALPANLPGAPAITPGDIFSNLRPRFQSTLDPVKQAAIDYLRSEGVPLTGSDLTGSRLLRASEAITAHLPLASGAAEKFTGAQSQAMGDLSSRLAEQTYPTPVTPYFAGQEAAGALGKKISDLNQQEHAAYEGAWQGENDPQFTKKVQVGTKREPILDANGKPTGTMQNVPVYDDVNMPVDIRWMKQIARNELPKLEFLPAAERAQSNVYSVYSRIGKGKDHITAAQAEKALSGLKAESMGAPSPDLRNVSQGVAASLIPRLQASIDAAVGETGQGAMEALQNGRDLHRQKMEVAEVADKLRESPVELFNQMFRPKDAGIDLAKEVAKHAPDMMQRFARAWADQMFEKATQEGGWQRTGGLLREWQKLGPQTKALMFPDASLRKSLERFFLGSSIVKAPFNTSGSGLVISTLAALQHPALAVKGFGFGKLLFSPKGIKLLTGIMQDPPRTAADLARVRAQAENIGGPPEEPPEGPPEGSGPPPGAPSAPAGGTLADSLQKQADAAIQRMRDRGDFTGRMNAGVPVDSMTDMAIWGAAKIAKGATKFGAWSKEMLDDAGGAADQIKPQLSKLWLSAQKTFQDHVAKTAGQLANTKKLMEMYKQGESGKDWYLKTRKELEDIFGPDDARMMVKFLAATSPNNTVPANVAMALKAYARYRMGQPFEVSEGGFQKLHAALLDKAAAGEPFGGLKAQSFEANLFGDPIAVTVDRWIARAMGFGDKVNDAQYKFADYMLTQIAKRQGMEPRQLQAAIWKAVKDQYEAARKKGTTGQPFEELLPAKIAKDPQMQQLIQRAKGGEASPARPPLPPAPPLTRPQLNRQKMLETYFSRSKGPA